MRRITSMVLAGFALATSVPAFAAQGSYSSALRTMLSQTAAGTCPASLMADDLLKACKEQLPRLKPEMMAAGPIKSLTFVKADTVKGERMETYKVGFTKGAPQTWHIGGFKEGKFRSAYNDGK